MSSSRIRQRASGRRARTPVLEHGASRRIASKGSRKAIRVPSPAAQRTFSRRRRRADSRTRPMRSGRSTATTSPRPPMSSARCVTFPPGAAQRSRTRSRGCGSRSGATFMDVSSCTVKRPSAKPGSSAGSPSISITGPPAPGGGRRGLTRAVTGRTALSASRTASRSGRRFHRSRSQSGWEERTPGWSGSSRSAARRRTALAKPADRRLTPRASSTASWTAARRGMRLRKRIWKSATRRCWRTSGWTRRAHRSMSQSSVRRRRATP